MEILNFLNGVYPMSPELINYLSNILKTKTLKKDEYLLRAGDICKNVYFVKKGLLRSLYLKGDKEISKWFMKENDVVYAVKSFLEQVPSLESIQALDDCTLQYITYSQLQDVCRRFPEFLNHRSILTEHYYKLSEERHAIVLYPKAIERYQYLLQNYPELIGRVPAKYIASYLGVSKATLNRHKNMLYGHPKNK
ncbi:MULTISPECIES: Crp/Fnr family transcriptional regulator [Niastella]|uniref:Crp/Fnr family transcriptional regulator n=1 Tax=Niastella soli TaxID=2821487 RepID=A0ABS3Z612_9BACT|nr:Crp/Fnr family transcriptional regulator [Niastella soli]MBO9205120.1 Crp/Fnr family transcriptional regulator [Niastella soli]